MRKFLMILLFVGVVSCGDEQSAKSIDSDLDLVGDKDQGAELYTANCAKCHKALSVSNKRGKTAAQIKKAIGKVAKMAHLKKLTDVQIADIAAALRK